MRLLFLLLTCTMLHGCTLLIQNEYYQFIDRSKTVYDAGAYFTNTKSSTEIILESLQPKVKRVTGFACSGKMYSDYPCMEAEGCILINF